MNVKSDADAARDRLVREGRLERLVARRPAEGTLRLGDAELRLESARKVKGTDTTSAFTLAYDAAYLACTAMLAHLGFRPTALGGHAAVEAAIRCENGSFQDFGWLRRRGRELDYPARFRSSVTQREIADAISTAARIVAEAGERIAAST